MDLGLWDILKKAEFNTLMLSVAITGWILYILVSMNIYILGAAILSSAYCIIRFVVFAYQYYSAKCAEKRYENQKRKLKENEKIERKRVRNIEISRMFNGLSDYNKFQLSSLILNGEKDSYNCNVLHFQKLSNEVLFIDSLISVTEIFNDGFGIGDPTLSIREYADKIAVTIDPYLFELTKQYIDNNSNQ